MGFKIENLNSETLRMCRIQIGLKIEEVQKKVKKIALFESGEAKPTFIQLNQLSELYKVPRWVFISKELPSKYSFSKAVPAFRKFSDSNSNLFQDSKIRAITAKVERYRELILDLREDMGDKVLPFRPPSIAEADTPKDVSEKIRKWLFSEAKNFDFSEWRSLLEEKGIFVFMTSKYKGWSHVSRSLFRGLTIYHSVLPIIIINDSDANKAQSFTLFHELAHILRKESAIDQWDYHDKKVEKWCDEVAGNFLMPSPNAHLKNIKVSSINEVKSLARIFKISPYACLVRLLQIHEISQKTFESFEDVLKKEFIEIQSMLKESESGPPRYRSKELLNQYGKLFTRAVFQAYHNKEIGLHKLSKIFEIKNSSYVLEMEKQF